MAIEMNKENKSSVHPAFQPGALVTLRDHIAKAFNPKYKGEY